MPPLALPARLALISPGFCLWCLTSLATVVGPPANDGDFREWSDFGNGNVRVFAAADRIHIYIRLESSLVLQAGSGVVFYIDTDNNAATGYAKASVGAEYFWDAGARSGVAFTATGEVGRAIRHTDLEWISAPVTDSSEFEISMRRENLAAEGCAVLVERNGVALGAASASYASRAVPRSVSPSRAPHTDFRLMAYNVLNDDLLDDPIKKDRFLAEFALLQPDVICFTEIYNHSADAVRSRVAEALPYMTEASGDGSWDSRIVSRYPIVFEQANGSFHCARVRSENGDVDVMVLTAHLRCCEFSSVRAGQFAAMSDFVARLRSGLLPDIPAGLPVIVAGDLNLVRNDAANFAGFQSNTGLRPLRALHLARRESYTWRSDNAPSGYSPGQLDYILSGAGLVPLHAFVYEPADPPSDHLPVVADFATDMDRNGLADRWERACFGSLGRSDTADEDLDRWSNAVELRLGTDPTDPASEPRLQAGFASDGAVLRLSGHGNGNAAFRLMRSTDLRTWAPAGRWMAGSEELPVEASGRAYYRLSYEN